MKMNTDENMEDLLSQHEHEVAAAARLKAEVRLKMPCSRRSGSTSRFAKKRRSSSE